MPRKYTHVKHLEESVFGLKAEGKTNGEISQYFGLTMKQLKNLITRHNCRAKKIQAGIPIKRRGRPPIKPPAQQKKLVLEITRLRMENELLRSFLQAAGRR